MSEADYFDPGISKVLSEWDFEIEPVCINCGLLNHIGDTCDTEFMEDGRLIELLSIALVCEDGRQFYAENLEAHANTFVKDF